MLNPKVLTVDIETMPIEARVWGIGKQYLSTSNIKTDWKLGAWGAKWLDDTKVMYQDTRKSDEKALLPTLHALLSQADLVVGQNIKKFDMRKLNAKFLQYGMAPLPGVKVFDTYKEADKIADFTSHSLAYMSQLLNTDYKKSSHAKYPGMKLWDECLAGNIDAWKEMEKYNKLDVLATEELYLKLRAWAPKANGGLYGVGCKGCGSARIQKRGFERTSKLIYQRYQCQACGAWQRGEKI